MVKYLCDCGYEVNDRSKMQRHLDRKTSCIFDKNMKIINVDTLLVGEKMIRENLSHLTKSGREKRKKITTKIKINTKFRTIGNMTLEQFVKKY